MFNDGSITYSQHLPITKQVQNTVFRDAQSSHPRCIMLLDYKPGLSHFVGQTAHLSHHFDSVYSLAALMPFSHY